jgi:hypothetical protein
MTPDSKDTIRIGITILLLFLAALAFYYSLFWGWASVTGAGDQPRLKTASNIALVVSLASIGTSIGIWLVPYLAKKRRISSNKTGA